MHNPLIDSTKLTEPTNFRPMAVVKFLSQNERTIQNSGIFTRPQMDLITQVENYADQLSRTGQLNNLAGNSATARRGVAGGQNFVDGVFSPLVKQTGEFVAGLGGLAGFAHGGLHGGAAGLIGGRLLGAGMGAVTNAENALRETMSLAILDPRAAQDLIQRVNARSINRLGDRSLGFLNRWSRIASAAQPGLLGAGVGALSQQQPGQALPQQP